MSETHPIFGTGPLAQSVMRALIKRGKAVTMVNRSGRRPADAPDNVTITAGDAYDPAFTREICQGAEVVYQCAQPEYHQWVEKFPPLQAAILEGTAAVGAKFVVGENLYMYGDPDGKPIHEELPFAAHTRKGKVRAEMASDLMAAHGTGKVRVAMARGSDFYGPGVLGSSLGERALMPLLLGKPAEAVASLDLPHTYTFIDDFGEAMVILGERDEALGQAWHVPNSPTLTQRQLLAMFFEAAGLPPKFSVMGRFMSALGGLFIPAARESVEMMYEFEKPFIVDSSKFIRAFGDIATPHEKAVQATLAWYRRHLADHYKK